MKFKPGNIVFDEDRIYEVIRVIKEASNPQEIVYQLKTLSYISESFWKIYGIPWEVDHTKPVEQHGYKLKLWNRPKPKFYFNERVNLSWVSAYIMIVFYKNHHYYYIMRDRETNKGAHVGLRAEESYLKKA